MSQHDYIIDNQLAPAFRADLNAALNAAVTQNSGASAPSTTYANMLWYDTTNDLLKIRNEANSGWITMGTVDQTNNVFNPNSTPIITGGMTLLGTLTMTSSISQSLTGLTLTSYKQLWVVYNGVSVTSVTQVRLQSAGISTASPFSGMSWTDLTTGLTTNIISSGGTNVAASGLTTANTSISVNNTGGIIFTAGTVYIYGVK